MQAPRDPRHATWEEGLDVRGDVGQHRSRHGEVEAVTGSGNLRAERTRAAGWGMQWVAGQPPSRGAQGNNPPPQEQR
eukprot:8745816-Alexandrium_andersonii.AAC.1